MAVYVIVDIHIKDEAAFEGYMDEHGGSIVNIVAECRNGFPGMVHTVRPAFCFL